MTAEAFKQVQDDFKTVHAANALMVEAMSEFQAACVTGSWDRTEGARAKAHDSLDAFFNAYAAAHKVMERLK